MKIFEEGNDVLDVIEIPVWAGNGSGMLYRRDCLPPEHPDSQYNYMLKNFPDLDPADYGIKCPAPKVSLKKCPCCGFTID